MLLARLSPAAAAARPATTRVCSRPLTNMIAGLTGKKEKAESGAVDAAEPRAPHELVLGAWPDGSSDGLLMRITMAFSLRMYCFVCALVDRFCLRQFDDPKYLGTQIRFDKAEFERKVNEIYLARNKELVDGCVCIALDSTMSV